MKKCIARLSVFVAVLGIATLGVAGTASASAQGEKPKASTQADKGKHEGAKPHTMTGCVEKGPNATTFMLTNVEGTGPKTVELHAAASKKLVAHVGHKVAVTGTEMKEPAKGKEASASTAEHRMRVESVKMISDSCK